MMFRKIALSPQLLLLILFLIFFTPVCGVMFQCGCTQLWSGAHSQCNYFEAGPPDCPWCAAAPSGCAACKHYETAFQIIPMALVYLPPFAIVTFLRKKRRGKFWLDLLIGIAAIGFFVVLVGFLYRWAKDYPYFFSTMN